MSDYTQKQLGYAILTIVVYTFFFQSFWMAVLLAGAVAWHEYCHLMAARKMGLSTGGFYLMPFIGGVSFVTERYRTYGQQAFVVLAGPMGGGLGALVTAVLWVLTGIPWLGVAAHWMCFLNLFNMLPLSFLDGGQVMGTINYSINRIWGVVCLTISTGFALLILLKLNPMIAIFVGFFGVPQVWKEIQNAKAWSEGNRYLCSEEWLRPPRKLTVPQMALTIFCWVASSIGLVLLSTFTK